MYLTINYIKRVDVIVEETRESVSFYRKALHYYRSHLTSRARKRQFEKKERTTGIQLRGCFRIAKPELVCAIRILGITDNLGRSRPFSPSDGMFCILRRCRISFALSEDRPPPLPLSSEQKGKKRERVEGDTREAQERTFP